MNQLGINLNGEWPSKIETKDYGTFIRIYPGSDESLKQKYTAILPLTKKRHTRTRSNNIKNTIPTKSTQHT